MSVQLVVKGGPDAGRTYSLQPGVTNIGRGPNAQIRLADGSLHGTITVEAVGGVCRVRHDLPHQIYLNRQPFPPGESRTWFHGHELQPTADTVLTLKLLGEKSDEPEKSKTGQWILAGGLGVCAVILFALPTPGDAAPETRSKDKPDVIQAGLLKMTADRTNDSTVSALPKLFAAARSDELRGRITDAFDSYSRFRDAVLLCEAKPRRSAEMLSAEEEASIAAAKRFINDRLIELSPKKETD